MADFPYAILDARSKELAEGLRWRWRSALRNAVSIVEADLKKALDINVLPPPLDVEFQIDVLLFDLHEQAQAMLEESLGLSVASGVWSMSKPWKGAFVQPTAKELAEIRRKPTFQDNASMRFALSYGGAAVKAQDAAVMGRFKLNLYDALREGKSPRVAAQQTAESLGEDAAPWERIARTEMARAQHMGAVEEAKRLGVDYVVVPDQPKNCEHCRRLLANRVFPLSALESASNLGKKAASWIAAIPLHPNCTCVAIPASRSTVNGAKEIAGGEIPSIGVSIEGLPQPKDR